ncbi:hypothetical protein FXN63_18770 [Pigmentiphaga aceris]|uniref:Uncharacterized protein n=2 Tax=Pigmentiphaga aceris TaxID=1940612 RepID=A0A5C0B1L0_9BURK|nr:hypothetical protein [Pigmentiphaga aceris]QEI07653.1 hypothetical protein FXN63_18770 [Pigmentiphaga aceris]
MPAGLNLPKPSFSTTANVYSPIGASGDPLSGAVKSLPGAIAGKLKGLWQSIRGTAKPERSVVDAGPGDYRLQRKGQTGYQRLNILDKAPPRPQATYASPEGARVRVVPSRAEQSAPGSAVGTSATGTSVTGISTSTSTVAPTGGSASGSVAPTTDRAALDTLIARVLTPATAPATSATAPTATRSISEAFDRLVTSSANRRTQEAEVLADIDQLVRLADAQGESLRPQPGQPRSEASKAFDMLVGKLMTVNVGASGAVLQKLAASDGSAAGMSSAAYRHAAGPQASGSGAPSAKLKLEVADRLLGHASRYDPPAHELADLSPGDRRVLKTSRLRESERDTGDTLATATKSIGDSVLALHRAGILDADVLKPLASFPPLATQTHSKQRSDQIAALPVMAELLAAAVEGNPGVINLLTAGDSRHDAVAVKLKTIDMPEGSEVRQQTVLRHTLSRAKHELAQAWTQQEKVSRITGSDQALGGFGRLGTRTGQVINPGGSDQLRVNAQLLRVLREGPSRDVAAREASARQGAGIQTDARAGKDVNLLIAQVMLLQKHVDAMEGGGTLQARKDQLVRDASALPQALQEKLGDALSASALALGERPGVIALGLSTPRHLDLLKQAFAAERDHEEALGARTRLNSADQAVSTQAQRDLTGAHGVYTGLVKDMNAVPDSAPSSAPLTSSGRLDAVIDQRAASAAQARDQLASALGCDDLSTADIRSLGTVLQGIDGVQRAEQDVRHAAEDGALGLSDKDFAEMGFSPEETAQVKQELSGQLGQPIEALFHQGLRSTADAAKVTDAVNNGINRLFVKGTSALTQGTMRDVAKAFPETAARQYIASVLALAHPVVGGAAQASSRQVFSGVFGDALSAPDRPLGRLMQRTGMQVATAQTAMTRLVGELSDLDTGAAVARKVLDQVSTPSRKFDPGSDSAKVNATRLKAAGDTLDTLDQVTASITAAQQDLAVLDGEAQGKRIPVAGQVAADTLAANTSHQEVQRLQADVDAIQVRLNKPGQPADVRSRLEADHRTSTQALSDARIVDAECQARLVTSQAALTELNDELAAERAPYAEILTMRENMRDGLQTRLDTQIQSLRWMSPSTLERSVRPQDRITTVDGLRSFLANPDNQSAVTALDTLHGLPGAKETKLRQITDQATEADAALAAYRGALSSAPGKPIDPGQLQSAVRCAVLEVALAWPDGPTQFDPAAHRDAIEAKLQEWGLDSAVIRPEIDAVLHQNFDIAQIEEWTKDAEVAFRAPAKETPGIARRAFDAARVFVTDSSVLDTGTRRSLLDSVRSMHVGDSLGLSRGLSWGLDTTPTAVEATGNLTAQVVVDIKSKNALEVRRTEEGVEVVFKAGMDGGGSLAIGATLYGAAKATASASGGHESLSGAGFRFPDTESAVKFLDTILDGKKVSPRTWATARETALVSDRATRVGASLDGKVTAKHLMAKVPGSEVALKYLSYEGEVAGSSFDFLGGAQAKLSASREWRTTQQQNASGHVVEKSRSTTVEGSVTIGIWASLPTVQDSVIDHFVDDNPVYSAIDDAVNRNGMMSGAPQAAFGAGAKNFGGSDNHVFDPFSPASAKMFSLNLSAKRTLGESTSLAFERDGLLSASGNTMTRSVVITGRASERDLALIQPGFSSKSSRSRGDDSLFNAVKEMRAGETSSKMLDELLATAKPGSSLSVTYALKEDARLIINDMIKSAEHAEKIGDLARAQILGDLARSMYEDEKNYSVDTIQVSAVTSVDNSTTLASVGIMTVGRVSEGSAERPTMILAMPGGPTAKSMAAERALSGATDAPPATGPGSASGTAGELAGGSMSTSAFSASDGVTSLSGSASSIESAPADSTGMPASVSTEAPVGGTDAPPVMPATDAISTDPSSSSAAPTTLVNVDALAVESQVQAVPESDAQIGAARSPWDQALRDRFDAALLPALGPVPHDQFHVEPQVASACAIHSINAFVGGPAFDIPTFTTWSTASTAAFIGDDADALAPESAASGFSPHRVERALNLLDGTPATQGKDWNIGVSILSPRSGAAMITQVTLPALGDTDRLIFDVKVGSDARTAAGADDIDHFVAFRKDDQGAWWLLDSRSSEVHAPPGQESSGSPLRRQIEPQAWLNEITTTAHLKTVALIGPGITGQSLTDVPRAST